MTVGEDVEDMVEDVEEEKVERRVCTVEIRREMKVNRLSPSRTMTVTDFEEG